MRIISHIVIFCFAAMLAASGQKAHTFSEIDSLQRIEPRMTVVFIHTDWCKYCQQMTHVSFQNKTVRELLAKHYYFAVLNAESQEEITFGGKTYRFIPTGNGTGTHELAQKIGAIDGLLSFPSLCILSHDRNILYQHGGYLSSRELMSLLSAPFPK